MAVKFYIDSRKAGDPGNFFWHFSDLYIALKLAKPFAFKTFIVNIGPWISWYIHLWQKSFGIENLYVVLRFWCGKYVVFKFLVKNVEQQTEKVYVCCHVTIQSWPIKSDNVDVMKTNLIIVSFSGNFFLTPSPSLCVAQDHHHRQCLESKTRHPPSPIHITPHTSLPIIYIFIRPT